MVHIMVVTRIVEIGIEDYMLMTLKTLTYNIFCDLLKPNQETAVAVKIKQRECLREASTSN